MSRPSTVRVLGCIALVLFSLNLLQFVSLNIARQAPAYASTHEGIAVAADAGLDAQVDAARRALDQATRRLQRVRSRANRVRCETDRHESHLFQAQQAVYLSQIKLRQLQAQQRAEATIEHELRLRAAQNPEVDPALRTRASLNGTAPQIPIMR